MTSRSIDQLLPPKARRKPRIGLVAGGLGTYWPQFPDLLPQLQAEMAPFFADLDGTPDTGFVVLTEVFNLEDQLAALDPSSES